MTSPLTSAQIKARAQALGFDACGIAPAIPLPELGFFRTWLDRGYAGDMTYLHRSAGRREDARAVLPSARTVIAVAVNYNTARPYSTEGVDPARAHISRYAWGDDYHEVLGSRLEALLAWVRDASPVPFDARAYVDTGPVQERVYAQHAGIGWIGKNTCVIHPDLGSWIVLGEILCSLDLEVDDPAQDRCGACTLCLEACPTGAFAEPRVLDATRCLSYLTIERRGEIDEHERRQIGTHVYGCDICQEVCPWNQMPAVSRDPAWQPRPEWDGRTISELRGATDDQLRTGLRHSAMRRAGVARLRRNLDIAAGNRPHPADPPSQS
jgi:epoxyqueuosine reductase